MVGAPVCRQQVAYAQARGLSCRKACAALNVARSSLYYESKKAAAGAARLTVTCRPLGARA